MVPGGLVLYKTKGTIARMHLHPTDSIRDGGWVCLLFSHQFFIELILRQVAKLSVIHEFLDKVVHRTDVASEQLVDATVLLIFDLKFLADTCIVFFVVFTDLDYFYGALSDNPVDSQRVAVLATWTQQGFSNHKRATLSELFVDFVMLAIPESRVRTGAAHDPTFWLSTFAFSIIAITGPHDQ